MKKTLAFLPMLWASLAHAAVNDLPGGPAVNQLNMHPAVTRIAADQAYLHYYMLIVCGIIFVAVFGVMFYSIFRHRLSRGGKPATFKESIPVEIAWTIIPFLIVIAMALPATKTVVSMKDTTNADLTIKVTGMQWKWGYTYIKGEGEGIDFLSTLDNEHYAMSVDGAKGIAIDNYLLKVDNPLVVPVDTKVRVITTANDVIHGFAVPSLGIQAQAIPGFVRDTWFRAEQTGDFYGQCTKICGTNHAYMPIHVRVLSQADYTVWAVEQKKLAAEKAKEQQ